MKVLLCHTYYQQRGGEDETFESEARLLESRGHEVVRFTRHNDEVRGRSMLTVAGRSVWDRRTLSELRGVIERQRPDVMHATNLFPLLSPSVYAAARDTNGVWGGVPVVQALRNFRVFCVGGVFTRAGKACTECRDGGWAGRLGWPGVKHGCYRGSRPGSLAVAVTNASYRRAWMGRGRMAGPDLFLTPSEFAKRWYVEGGFDAERIRVKPNYSEAVPGDAGLGAGAGAGAGYALFVGRLSEEKGIGVLLKAWEQGAGLGRLVVVGDGPEGGAVRSAAERGVVQWLGRRNQAECVELMRRAAFVVMPSLAPETFGRSVVEGYGCGVPALASRAGALPEVVRDGQTGLLCEVGDAGDLAAKASELFADAGRRRAMGEAARAWHAERFSPEENYRQLIAIYEEAIARRRAEQRAGTHAVSAAALSGVVEERATLEGAR
ncbi:MAG: glycosyltransferase family 4 protein [Planctomycetota bacterium]